MPYAAQIVFQPGLGMTYPPALVSRIGHYCSRSSEGEVNFGMDLGVSASTLRKACPEALHRLRHL